MFRFLKKLMKNDSRKSSNRRTRLNFECLEDRCTPSGGFADGNGSGGGGGPPPPSAPLAPSNPYYFQEWLASDNLTDPVRIWAG